MVSVFNFENHTFMVPITVLGANRTMHIPYVFEVNSPNIYQRKMLGVYNYVQNLVHNDMLWSSYIYINNPNYKSPHQLSCYYVQILCTQFHLQQTLYMAAMFFPFTATMKVLDYWKSSLSHTKRTYRNTFSFGRKFCRSLLVY